jgi:hypothetical protein
MLSFSPNYIYVNICLYIHVIVQLHFYTRSLMCKRCCKKPISPVMVNTRSIQRQKNIHRNKPYNAKAKRDWYCTCKC